MPGARRTHGRGEELEVEHVGLTWIADNLHYVKSPVRCDIEQDQQVTCISAIAQRFTCPCCTARAHKASPWTQQADTQAELGLEPMGEARLVLAPGPTLFPPIAPKRKLVSAHVPRGTLVDGVVDAGAA